MRSLPVDSPWGINPSPEELAIDGWLDNTDPYVSLRQPKDRPRLKAPVILKPGPALSRRVAAKPPA